MDKTKKTAPLKVINTTNIVNNANRFELLDNSDNIDDDNHLPVSSESLHQHKILLTDCIDNNNTNNKIEDPLETESSIGT